MTGKNVMIVILVVALVIALIVFIPRYYRVTGELASTKTALDTAKSGLNATESELTAAKNKTETLEQEKKTLEEENETLEKENTDLKEEIEALTNLPAKAEVEAVLRSVWRTGVDRADIERALRTNFPNLSIRRLHPEGGPCYLEVEVAEGWFYIQGPSLEPLEEVA